MKRKTQTQMGKMLMGLSIILAVLWVYFMVVGMPPTNYMSTTPAQAQQVSQVSATPEPITYNGHQISFVDGQYCTAQHLCNKDLEVLKHIIVVYACFPRLF